MYLLGPKYLFINICDEIQNVINFNEDNDVLLLKELKKRFKNDENYMKMILNTSSDEVSENEKEEILENNKNFIAIFDYYKSLVESIEKRIESYKDFTEILRRYVDIVNNFAEDEDWENSSELIEIMSDIVRMKLLLEVNSNEKASFRRIKDLIDEFESCQEI